MSIPSCAPSDIARQKCATQMPSHQMIPTNKQLQKTEKTVDTVLGSPNSHQEKKASDSVMLPGQKSCLSQALSGLGMVKPEFY